MTAPLSSGPEQQFAAGNLPGPRHDPDNLGAACGLSAVAGRGRADDAAGLRSIRGHMWNAYRPPSCAARPGRALTGRSLWTSARYAEVRPEFTG
jgi:hypothetical protein